MISLLRRHKIFVTKIMLLSNVLFMMYKVLGLHDNLSFRLQQAQLVPSVLTESHSNNTVMTNSSHSYLPSYFTEDVPFQIMVKALSTRGMNLINPRSGCSMTTWIYQPRGMHLKDCLPISRQTPERELTHPGAASLVKNFDTVYVPFTNLECFVNDTLPKIQSNFVLLSGQWMNTPLLPKYVFECIVSHPHLVHWFMQNMHRYSHDRCHPKISPFPYGVLPRTRQEYAAELQRRLERPAVNKSRIMVSYMKMTNPNRTHVPNGRKLPFDEYLRTMRESEYVLASEGDRPETIRLYEAIGLGTVPLVDLDKATHSHLAENVVFISNWNLTELESTLPHSQAVNSRLIFEEYWMEYVERSIGHPLNWWYTGSQQRRVTIAEIANQFRAALNETYTKT